MFSTIPQVAYQFPCDYAGLGFSPYAICWRQCAASTSYLTVVGNNCSSRASLHPDHQLPNDLWWAHSPGCPPPTHGKEVRSVLGVKTPSWDQGKWHQHSTINIDSAYIHFSCNLKNKLQERCTAHLYSHIYRIYWMISALHFWNPSRIGDHKSDKRKLLTATIKEVLCRDVYWIAIGTAPPWGVSIVSAL